MNIFLIQSRPRVEDFGGTLRSDLDAEWKNDASWYKSRAVAEATIIVNGEHYPHLTKNNDYRVLEFSALLETESA